MDDLAFVGDRYTLILWPHEVRPAISPMKGEGRTYPGSAGQRGSRFSTKARMPSWDSGL